MNKNYLLNVELTKGLMRSAANHFANKLTNFRKSTGKKGLFFIYSKFAALTILLFILSAHNSFGAAAAKLTLTGGGNVAATVYPGESNVLIYSFEVAVATNNGELKSFTFSTATGGTATAADISGYTIFIQNSSVGGSSLTAMGMAPVFIGNVTFTAATATYTVTVPEEMYFAKNNNYYVYIEANFNTTAVAGHEIYVTAEGNDFTMVTAPTYGTNGCSAGGEQVVGSSCAQYYAYTGGYQSYTVPLGCQQLAITAAGATGGSTNFYQGGLYISNGGGLGGLVTATVTATPGATYTVTVGGMGSNSNDFGPPGTGGFNGGAVGGYLDGLGGADYYGGSCGGGASDVRISPYTYTAGGANLLVVAGGGGGAGWVTGDNYGYNIGGAGGSTTAGSGYYNDGTSTTAGQGGTQANGGAGGLSAGGAPIGNPGSLDTGGAGSDAGDYGYYNAGGGGGYYGGGAGATVIYIGGFGGGYYYAGVAGGGGSSFVPATATVGTNTAGVNAGNGYVAITPVVAVYTVTSSGTSCSGITIGLNGSQVGVNYQVYDGSTATGGTTAGTGGVITLGTFTVAGTYTVSGTLACGGNAVGMSGSVIVTAGGGAGTINGNLSICGIGGTTSLSDATTGGTWSSSGAVTLTGIATTTATVTATGAGVATITYSVGGGCNTVVTVNIAAGASAINGNLSICGTGTTSLSDVAVGGTWSTTPGTGSVNLSATTGSPINVTGVTNGTATVSYSTGASCYSSVIVTVNASPTAGTINGAGTVVCVGSTIPLTNTTAAGGTGTWSSGTVAVGTVGATTGVVYGVSSGTTNITYTETSVSCGTATVTATVTVNAVPTAGTINGTESVCVGSTTPLTNTTATGGTGTWSSGTVAVGTVGSTTGVVYGVSGGTTIITYTEASASCGTATITATVTVNAVPTSGTINGTESVCVGATTPLTNTTATGGTGTWSSGTVAVGTVGSTTGIVYGVSSGTTIITYTETSASCGTATITATVTVNAVPTSGTINGVESVCAGSTTSLSNTTATGGTGTWSSGTVAVGTVGSTTGVVYGVSSGTTIITYTETSASCGTATITATVTVNAVPTSGTINGTESVCVGATTPLTNTTAAGGTGTWSSSNVAVGTVGATTGVVYGVSSGTTIITYTETSASCGTATVTATVTVNISPAAGTITGPGTVCTGSTITLSNATASGGTGTWSSSNPGVGSADPTLGIVSGISGGTTMITYTETSAFCGSLYTTMTVTVNVTPNAGLITGSNTLCTGLTTTLADLTASGGTGTWSSSNTAVGTIGSTTGTVYGASPGTTIITYTETSLYCGSATTTTNMTVNVSPIAGTINGLTSVCTGSTITLSDATASGGSGAWSSSNPGVGSVDPALGIVTGISGGTTMITFTETSTSCGSLYTTMTVTVNASPNAGLITGSNTLCVGLTTTLTDLTASGGTGTWSSSNTAVGTAGSTTGTVYGVSAGTTTISYTETSLYCGSATTTTNMTVNVSPIAGTINGLTSVCTGSTITLSDATASGGTGAWSSSNPAVGTVGGATGVVYGVSGGTTMITFTETSASCGSVFATMTVTVNVSPNAGLITGSNTLCVGLTTTLADLTASGGTGIWSSSNTAVGTVGSTTGTVYGVSQGTTTISYTETSLYCGSATTTANMTVNVSPVAGTITGPGTVCSGLTITLSDATASGGTGAWTSSNPAAGTVGATGIVYGVSGGTTMITFTETSASCGSVYTTMIVTVNVSPNAGAIVGAGPVCQGLTLTLTNPSASGGTGAWSSSNTTVGTIGSTTGVVYGVSPGTTVINYTETSLYCGSASTTANVLVNVSPVAGTITGPGTVCTGLTITLSDATASGGTGAWTSSIPAVGTVGATTGVVYGVSGGTTMITFTETSASCGSAFTTTIVTVNVSPNAGAIVGAGPVCQGLTLTLTNPSASGGTGAWSSSNTTVGTIGSTTGVVYGVSPGTTVINYTETSLYCGSASTTANVLVNVSPVAGTITGPGTVCSGLTITLSDATASGGTGAWTSSIPTVGTVGATTGIVYGVSGGTTMITFTETSASCGSVYTTTIVTVNVSPNAGAIIGAGPVCVGSSLTLTNPSASGGTGLWSSSNTTVGTVGSTTGVVYGVSPGTTIIDYTETSLYCGSATTTANVVVNVSPSAGTITGTANVCVGLTITLSDATASGGTGTWSSSNAPVGTVGSTTGVVYGVSSGTTMITFTETSASCGSAFTTMIVTVNANPTTITGTTNVCVGLTTALNSSPAGGTWSSSNGNAAINATTGVVTGANPGTSTITYVLNTGCLTSTPVTVNANPTTITGTLSVCSGSSTILNSTPAGGTWSSSNAGVAAVNGTNGTVSGGSVAVTTTATITYTLPTGCIITAIVTVNPLPAVITGTLDVCAGLTTTLADASTPGTWSSNATGIATIGVTSGVVTGVSAGTSTIIFVLPTGCQTTAVVTVNPLPGSILGVSSVCQGSTTSLSDVSAGGTWSSSNALVATVSTGGIVTGTATGAAALTATITYTLPTGCIITDIVTVNPLPAAIMGTLDVCSGLSSTLTDATSGGTWSSSATGTASIILTTGVMTGGTAGTATITYKLLGTGCIATAVATVNPLPTSILGTLKVCSGLTTLLSDLTTGGTWSSSAPAIAAVGSSTGIVTGESVTVTGESIITYTLPTGCIATAVATVNPLPGTIEGIPTVCLGLKTYLSDATPGGAWSSSNTNAIISSTGVVTGNNVGTSTITYTLSTGCIMTATVTVNPLPASITGTLNVCVHDTVQLSDVSTGGTWSSSNATIGSAGSVSGEVTGVSPGTATITYTLSTGCISTAVMTVNPQPDAIHGVASVCYGSSTSLSDSTVGGVWSSSSNLTASVGTSGAVTAEGVGTATISYTLAAGCSAFDVVTVNPLPSVFTVTPTGGTYCEGGSGDPIGLNGSQVGVSYLLYYDSSVAGYLAGTGLPLNFGLLTVAGTYTVRATNSTTGCISGMFGTAQIIITPTVNPVVSVVSLSGDTVCPGTSVLFTPDTLHAGASPTYKWFVNGVLVSTTANYTYIPANGDVVSVTLTSDGICVEPSTASGSLAMVVLPDAPPGVSISIYPGDTVCQYSVATFTATPTFGGPAPEYIWYVNGIQQTGGGQEFSYYPATGDIVYCKVVSDYRCRLADTGYSNSAVMTVTPMTVPHVEIMAGSGFIIEAGQTDSLWAVVSNAGPSPTYQWAVDGVTIPGATQAYYISQFNNYDSVTCTVTSSGACDGISAFDWIFITVYSTGVQQFSTGSGDIRLMPNPNNGVFTLKGTLGTAMAEEVTIEVTDMMGQVVYSGKVQTSGGRINEQIALGGSLANGMYLLNLKSGSDNKVFHFVIEK